MELRIYLSLLWRRKWVILVTFVVTMVVAIIGAFMATPKYVATTTLRLATSSGGQVDYGVIRYAERLMSTYAEIATSAPVVAELQQRLNVAYPPEIEIDFSPDSELIKIAVEDQNPVVAAEAANTLANILIMESRKTKEGRDHTFSTVEPAAVPTIPSKPRLELNIILGAIIGLAGGVGLAIVFENLDTTVYSTPEIEGLTRLPTLGEIPAVSKQPAQTIFLNGTSPQGEAFRRLRTNIFAAKPTLQTLLVTSAEPGEGKSTIVVNLALAIAHSGRKVIIIDADFRLPTLHKFFSLPNNIGLSNILTQNVPLAQALQSSAIAEVKILTSGPLPPRPVELLDSDPMAQLLNALKQNFDVILVDSPALLAVADAAVIASLVDGVILVVGQAQTRQEAIRAVQSQLATVKAQVIGVIVNRTQANKSYYYYHH